MAIFRVALLGLAALTAGADPSFLYPINITLDGNIIWIVAGDFNNDGIADFAVSYSTSGTAASIPLGYQVGVKTASVVLFLGSRDGHFMRRNLPQITPDASDIIWAAADLNLDGKLDLITPEGVALGNGDGTFQPLVPYTPAPHAAIRPLGIPLPYLPMPAGAVFQVADFNGDGIPDICSADSSPAGIFVRLGRGDGTFGPPIATGPFYPSVPGYPNGYDELTVFTLGDFDGDGHVDVAFGNTGGFVTILYGNGDGTFTRSGGIVVAGGDPGALISGNLRGDGTAALVEQASDGVGVMQPDMSGVYRVSRVYTSLSAVSEGTSAYAGYYGPLVMADFDGDKKQDIASYFGIYEGNGDGTLQAPILFGQEPGMTSAYNGDTQGPYSGLPYYPPTMVFADVNGDGKPDLIGVGPTLDTLTVLINSSGTPVASAPVYHAASGLQLLAPGAIAVLYGTGLSSSTATATQPLQTTLGNTSVEVLDFAGRTILAPLLYVSPTQINFQVPESAAVNGPAIINVLGNGLPKGAHSVLVAPVAPGIYTLDGSGKGAPVASAVRVAPDGTQTPLPMDQPIQVDSVSQVYLSLYGTGFRNAPYASCYLYPPGLSSTEIEADSLYVGPQSAASPVDQINIPIPSNTPKGPVNISCVFYSVTPFPTYQVNYFYPRTNTVTIAVK